MRVEISEMRVLPQSVISERRMAAREKIVGLIVDRIMARKRIHRQKKEENTKKGEK